MAISNHEVKKLYSLSAGRCNICNESVFQNDVHIGEMAHIIPRSVIGPRGKETFPGNKDSYDNLILLCSNHHSEVDKNPRCFPARKLRQIKDEHEKNIESVFYPQNGRKNDVIFLRLYMDFVPFSRLQYFINCLPKSVMLELCMVGDMFEALCNDNPHLYPLNDTSLQSYFGHFIAAYYDLWGAISGYSNVGGRTQANFSQADERFYLHMEKRYLPYNSIIELSRKLEKLKSAFISSYMQLIIFLRGNYKEVYMNQLPNKSSGSRKDSPRHRGSQ
ncbi:HNH endonuclease [Acidithiobacillus ferrivorans]|uniref:HNH endonuclease n=1 Tax=Acidithiobacillus ferrivorans TaxID=160808 RepID=UPI001C073F05|nr:HNH endonuclease signature motif containing protein [Acidithiobacillus ferrivorans]MBU2849721.1 HNH endonuclease [Acidithiobacillus ferrivorans]